MLVNFCGLRHLTEAVIPNIVEGGAIASIASSAGIGWLMNMEVLGSLLATPDFAAAQGVVRGRSEAHRQRLRTLEGGDQRVHRGAVVHAGAAGDPHQLPQPRARPTRR